MTEKARETEMSPGRPLWAPWRIEYIRSEGNDKCIFCEKASRDVPGDHIIARGEKVIVLLNTFPYNSGHLLIVPLRHVRDLSLLDEDEIIEMSLMSIRATKVLTRSMRPDGFNLGYNIGAAAGAGIRDHVHGHVVPRWVGDTNFMPVLGDTRVVPEALEKTAELLRGEWERTVSIDD